MTSPPLWGGLQSPQAVQCPHSPVYQDMAPSYRILTLGIVELPLGQGEARMVCAQIQASGPTLSLSKSTGSQESLSPDPRRGDARLGLPPPKAGQPHPLHCCGLVSAADHLNRAVLVSIL